MNSLPLKISRILHAGYVLEYADQQILFDPLFENPFSRNCFAFPSVEFDQDQIRKLKPAAIFISHYHDDHCSLESLNLLSKQTPIYIYCQFKEMLEMIRELGFVHVYPLKLNEPVRVGPFQVIPHRALDADVDSIFEINCKGLRILNVVDSWIDDETLSLLAARAPWDMVLWPFQTMRELEVICPSKAEPASGKLPEGWLEQLEELKPRYLVPSSCQFKMEPWSWYNQAFFPISYQDFQKQLESALPNIQVVRMNPAVSFALDQEAMKPVPALPWVKPTGPQDLDYDYKINLTPPTTAEVARNFPALSAPDTERVLSYCKSELVQKYQSLEEPSDPYFQKPQIWQLSVFDHQGEIWNFRYEIEKNQIRPTENRNPVTWSTEIPISRLYGALENGESLTSIYVRIETQNKDCDLMEDPLLRCLYNGEFGSYQKAQLKKLSKHTRTTRNFAGL